MRAFVLGLSLLIVIGCGSSSKTTYKADLMEKIGNYDPPPEGYKKVRVGIADFDDKTGQNVGEQAAVQMETLAHRSKRFNLIDRTQLKKILKEQGLEGIVDPNELAKMGRVRGVDYLFVGAITNFRVKITRTRSGFDIGGIFGQGGLLNIDTSKVTVETEVGVDIKLVNTTTGEIVAKDFGEVKRTDAASAWGLKIVSIGGRAKNDMRISRDSYGQILRWALDSSYKKMLQDIDDTFSKPTMHICPKCKIEVPANSSFCTKCGKNVGPAMCKSCGSEMEPGVKFCGKCGAKAENP